MLYFEERRIREKNVFVFIFTLVSLILLAAPAHAWLQPMSWGFPQMTQDRSLTSIEGMFLWQNDFEDTDISFPTAVTPGFSAFPTISQISSKTEMASSFKFSQQTESSKFSYPWISVGFSPVPSMGFL